MTSGQTSHITVTYRDSGIDVTRIYAISEHISCDLDRHMQKPTGKDLQSWLVKRGCRLDSADGPAVVWHGADGTKVEEYYRDGRRYRENGPAIVKSFADGSTEKTIPSR